MITEMRATVDELRSADLADEADTLAAAVDRLDASVDWLVEHALSNPDTPGAASVNLLMLAGVVLGGWQMARSLLVASGQSDYDAAFLSAKAITARFYLAHILPRSSGYARAAMSEAELVMSMSEDQF